jgi:hypothetical protein
MRRFLKEVSIFKALNDVRGPMRVGLLQHRPNLDLAAGYHNSFLFKSALYKNAADSKSTFDGIPGLHFHDQALFGSTKQSPAQRAIYAQYTGTIAENGTVNSAAGEWR